MKRFLLQAVQDEDNLGPVREVLGIPDLQRAAIGTAFMTESGLSLLEDALKPIAGRTRLFVGVRNGVTTAQSIRKALELGCETYMVDTGSNAGIFHPKLYYARGTTGAALLLGSANLTRRGLCVNIEASLLQTLDTTADKDFLEELEGKLDAMIANYPENVIRANDIKQLIDLHEAGCLLDECDARPANPAGKSGNPALDNVPKMALSTKWKNMPSATPSPLTKTAAASTPPEDLVQVWISKPLGRANIDLPNRPGTNPKGAMSLTAGRMKGKIDPRHYFRNEVFQYLTWNTDKKSAYRERATVSVQVIVKSIDYGRHELKLSHDTRTHTPAYKQNNYMTSLHWGVAKPYVAREGLLGRTLKLFRDTGDPARFTLEID